MWNGVVVAVLADAVGGYGSLGLRIGCCSVSKDFRSSSRHLGGIGDMLEMMLAGNQMKVPVSRRMRIAITVLRSR